MKVIIEIDNEKSGTLDWTIIYTKIYRPPKSKTVRTERTMFGASPFLGLDEMIKKIPSTVKKRKRIDVVTEVPETEPATP